MQFNSRTEILCKALSNNNSFLNIVAPRLSGKSQLINELKNCISIKSRSLVLSTDMDSMLDNSILELFRNELKCEYDLELMMPEEGIPLSDLLYTILKQLNSKIIRDIYFLIDDVNKVGLDNAYFLLSQIRNLREKLTANSLDINFCALCFGTWKPSDMQNICDNKFGSSFPLEMFLCDYNFIEVKDFIEKNNIPISLENLDDYKIKYLLEISGGCFVIIDYVIKNYKDEFNCKFIRSKAYEFSQKEFFNKYLESAIRELSEVSKKIIINTLGNRIVKYSKNKNSEELIMSGLMKKVDLYGIPLLVMRSWIHEISIRKNMEFRNILGAEYIFPNFDEIIPPTASINKIAYEIILEIENRLRNFIVVFLAGINNKSKHPLEMANDLGKMRDEWKNSTLYDELEFQKNKTKNLYSDFIDVHSSVSSFLTVIDIINLILKEKDNKGLNNYFSTVFKNNNENLEMFDKFRIIRNQVAHNNIITEKTIDVLIDINKKLINILSVKV